MPLTVMSEWFQWVSAGVSGISAASLVINRHAYQIHTEDRTL